MRLRVLYLLTALLLGAGPAWAAGTFSSFPNATLPLTGAEEIPLDQGSGCALNQSPCTTVKVTSTQLGQPIQTNCSLITAPFQYQQCIDNSVNPPVLKEYIGTAFFPVTTLSPTTGVTFNIPISQVIGLGTMASQNANAVAITGGTITGMPTPSQGADVAIKSYVDSKAAGLVIQTPVQWGTAAILPNTPTFTPGAGGGVGDTLTAVGNAAIVVDGGSPVLNDRVLVKNQASGQYNGIYNVTTVGSISVPWVLTRDGASAGIITAELQTGSSFLVKAGTVNANSTWVQTTPPPITIDTTPLIFSQFASSSSYTADNSTLQLVGSQFSIKPIAGLVTGTYGSATTIPTITVNATGQITAASSTALAPTIGSINTSAFTTGSVPFVAGGAFAQDNPNFFYDSTNKRLGIKTSAPIQALDVNGEIVASEGAPGSGGFSFRQDGAQDTGMFSSADGQIQWYNNGSITATVTATNGWSFAGAINAPQYNVGGSQISAANLANGTTGSGAIMLQANATATGTFTGNTINAAQYNINGRVLSTSSGTYNQFYDGSGNADMFLGGSGDQTNYYRNSSHQWQSVGGGTTFASVNSGTFTVNVGTLNANAIGGTSLNITPNGITSAGSITSTGGEIYSHVALHCTALGNTACLVNSTGDSLNNYTPGNWIFFQNGGNAAQVMANNFSEGNPATAGSGTACLFLSYYFTNYYGLTFCGSDARLKNIDGSIADVAALPLVEALKPVSFTWKDDKDSKPSEHLGLIAQDVLALMPLCVNANPDGYYGLDNECLVAYLAKSVQELSAKLKAHGID